MAILISSPCVNDQYVLSTRNICNQAVQCATILRLLLNNQPHDRRVAGPLLTTPGMFSIECIIYRMWTRSISCCVNVLSDSTCLKISEKSMLMIGNIHFTWQMEPTLILKMSHISTYALYLHAKLEQCDYISAPNPRLTTPFKQHFLDI